MRGATFCYHEGMSICPICGGEVKPRGANKAYPFCAARCQSIDLGKWLNEEYRVPASPSAADEDGDEELLAELAALEGDSPTKRDMRH